MTTIPLERFAFMGGNRQVRIYSREHFAWWHKDGNGYAIERKDAGVFSFLEALTLTLHCGPENGIEYEVVEST